MDQPAESALVAMFGPNVVMLLVKGRSVPAKSGLLWEASMHMRACMVLLRLNKVPGPAATFCCPHIVRNQQTNDGPQRLPQSCTTL